MCDCNRCLNYQDADYNAGLVSGCVADEIYKDEDCQVFHEENHATVESFQAGRLKSCPFFMTNL